MPPDLVFLVVTWPSLPFALLSVGVSLFCILLRMLVLFLQWEEQGLCLDILSGTTLRALPVSWALLCQSATQLQGDFARNSFFTKTDRLKQGKTRREQLMVVKKTVK